jgi:hypothetical protein
MNAPCVLCSLVSGDVWEQALIDGLSNEWRERRKSFRQSEENFKESVKSMLGVIEAKLAF